MDGTQQAPAPPPAAVPPPAAPMPPPVPMQKERPTGVTILAVLYMIGGISVLIGGFLINIILGDLLGSLSTIPGADVDAGLPMMCWIVFIVIALFYFLIAFGLLKGQKWARTLAIIFAIIGLINIPIGTIISIIILIYLFKPEVKAYFQ